MNIRCNGSIIYVICVLNRNWVIENILIRDIFNVNYGGNGFKIKRECYFIK